MKFTPSNSYNFAAAHSPNPIVAQLYCDRRCRGLSSEGCTITPWRQSSRVELGESFPTMSHSSLYLFWLARYMRSKGVSAACPRHSAADSLRLPRTACERAACLGPRSSSAVPRRITLVSHLSLRSIDSRLPAHAPVTFGFECLSHSPPLRHPAPLSAAAPLFPSFRHHGRRSRAAVAATAAAAAAAPRRHAGAAPAGARAAAAAATRPARCSSACASPC